MIAMACGQEVERLATVGGAEQARVLGVHRVDVLRISEDCGKIPGPLAEPSVIVDWPPVRAAVIGAVQTALRRLDHRVDAIGVRAGNRDVDAPENTRGQSVARQPGPAHATVGGTIQTAAGAAAREIPRLPPYLPERGIDNSGV